MFRALSLDLISLRSGYTAGTLTPTQLVEEALRRVEAYGDPAVWIHRLSRDELLAHAARGQLPRKRGKRPQSAS
jgi:allophanate hydrolase